MLFEDECLFYFETKAKAQELVPFKAHFLQTTSAYCQRCVHCTMKNKSKEIFLFEIL